MRDAGYGRRDVGYGMRNTLKFVRSLRIAYPVSRIVYHVLINKIPVYTHPELKSRQCISRGYQVVIGKPKAPAFQFTGGIEVFSADESFEWTDAEMHISGYIRKRIPDGQAILVKELSQNR